MYITIYLYVDMAVSIDRVVLFVGAVVIKALLLGVCNRDPDFWKLPCR